MCISVFYAQVIGLWLFLLALATLTQRAHFKKMTLESLSNEGMVAFSGMLSLAAGLIVVISHNIWMSGWPVVITLFGWFMLFQGVMRIFWQDTYVHYMKKLLSKSGYTNINAAWLLIGLYLIWVGFSA